MQHLAGNVIPVVLALLFFGINVYQRARRAAKRTAAERAAAQPSAAQPAPAQPAVAQSPWLQPAPAVAVRPRRRTLPVATAPEAPRAPVAPRAPAAPRAPVAPRPVRPPQRELPALAADAFPVLDLTLPDALAPGAVAPVARRARAIVAAGMPGSRGWGAGAVVALEILGPPVSLRSGATLGAPHAF